jgi:uncharacterized protein (DUF362 family)
MNASSDTLSLSDQKIVGLRFTETMSGYFAEREIDFESGERKGKTHNDTLRFDVVISIDNVQEFCRLPGRKATLTGTVSCKPLGQALPIRDGAFGLFRPDPATGKRHMTYSFGFTANDGRDYFFHGFKIISDDPSQLDLIDDMTRLFSRIHLGSSTASPVYGSGIIHFRAQSLPSMLASFEVLHTRSLIARVKAVTQFFSFCYGELRDTYFAKLSPVYHTEYENLVLSGRLKSETGQENDFFFFSGIHDKDFPWGDEEIFWDIALLLRDERGWSRYALTDRVIGDLDLDVEEGTLHYDGTLCEILEGFQLSRSELQDIGVPPHLRRISARIEFLFDCQKFPAVSLPFSLTPHHQRLTPRDFWEEMRGWLPHLSNLGWTVTPRHVRIRKGTIRLGDREFSVLPETAFGEAEKATLQNIRWPRLYYNYFCALSASSKSAYVRVRSDLLRENRKDEVLDRIQQEIGKLVSHIVRLDLTLGPGECKVLPPEKARTLHTLDDSILELNNDHFPTAVFQRRVVALRDEDGREYLALEEDMDALNLGSINSPCVATVAAMRDPDKLRALDNVLEATDFFAKLESAFQRSGRPRENFAIIVKPNFMFAYNVQDRSTFTDPELIEHLMDRLHELGYRNLACAEARSTYGVFFTNREVKTVGRYIGLTEKNYRLVDLSEDLEPYSFSGRLGDHFVNREWKSADFRIAFAKNKTHSYSRYTLALKVIYGALPMENKFLEYHNRRDIFSTTIEFLKRFPVQFALIDAHVSADGPFGIFADKNPNPTETVIGSDNIVACDWIGAAKMGLDPMISDYMKLAVEAFGKPRIRMVGDRTLYTNWVNVTDVIPMVTLGIVDRDYYFGNLFYSVFSYMDDCFQYKDPGFGRTFVRKLLDPMKSLFFQRIEKGELDLELNRKLYQLFTQQ